MLCNLQVSPCDHLRQFSHLLWYLLICLHTISRKGKLSTIFRRFKPKNYCVSPFLPTITTPLRAFLYVRISGLSLNESGDHASIKLKRRYLGPRGWPLFVLSFRWIRARKQKLGRTFQNTVCTKFVPRKDWEWADHWKILNYFVIHWLFLCL